jgi:2-polyprenyl-3-methyl-5-hydroxy-6-metoxy-1,4-benzoquinol methylase
MFLKDYYKTILERLILQEKNVTCGNESSQRYIRLDANRLAFVLDVCKREIREDCAILDVGRSHLTGILHDNFKNVTSLGLDLNADDGGHRELSPLTGVKHVSFNLEEISDVDSWPEIPAAFGMVVCTEVIEHLTVSPEVLFLFFHYILKEKGKLILSTPNAVSFRKRIAMVRGRQPYEKLRLYRINPGHYREYTGKELCSYLRASGFSVEKHLYADFRESHFALKKCLRNPHHFLDLLPEIIPELRDSIFLVAQKCDMQ